MRAEEDFVPWEDLEFFINEIKRAEVEKDHDALRQVFKKTVSGYNPKEGIQDTLYLNK